MQPTRVAVLSDTHGLLHHEVLPHLTGVDAILHAGDVGNIAILEALRAFAPVTAIRGNIDRTGPTAALPATEAVELGGHLVYMLHNLAELDLKPEAAGISVVIYGHSHKPASETRNGVLYLNPGACGPRRFSLPVTMAMLTLAPSQSPAVDFIQLL